MCGITLLYKEVILNKELMKKVFKPKISKIRSISLLDKLDASFTLKLRERDVFINVYKYEYEGVKGEKILFSFWIQIVIKTFKMIE